MMDIDSELLNAKEGLKIEFKEAANKVPQSFYETYSSFANTRGGVIYLGVREGKRCNVIVGVNEPDQIAKDIMSSLENPNKCSCNVLRDDDLSILESSEGKKVIRVRVREAVASEKPVYLNGSFNEAYKRNGDGDFRMKVEEISYFLNGRYEERYDSRINTVGVGVDSLDEDSIKGFMKVVASFHQELDIESLDKLTFLRRIGAYVTDAKGNSGITNGAVLFFGYLPAIRLIYPYYEVDYQRYEDNVSERWTKRITTSDLSMNGNLFSFFQAIRQEIKPYLPNPFYREGWTNLNGNDIYAAVLEGVANALSNAAFMLEDKVLFRQTPTSFLFHNPGRIGVDIEQVRQGGLSRPFNPTILNFFRLMGIAEKAGLGIPKIFNMCNRYNFREPQLYEMESREATELVISFLSVPADLPSRPAKMKIINFLSSCSDGATISGIMDALSMSRSQVTMNIRELIAAKLVTDNGKTRKGRRVYLRK